LVAAAVAEDFGSAVCSRERTGLVSDMEASPRSAIGAEGQAAFVSPARRAAPSIRIGYFS
jgi:hypothetical protein